MDENKKKKKEVTQQSEIFYLSNTQFINVYLQLGCDTSMYLQFSPVWTSLAVCTKSEAQHEH